MEEALEELAELKSFTRADQETQTKMLRKLYEYAAEKAKAELFDEYEPASAAGKIDGLMKSGLSMAEAIAMVTGLSSSNIADYHEMIEAGMDNDAAGQLAEILDDLEPPAGEDRVQDVQRWRECVNFSSNAAVQMSALYSQMTEAQFKKLGDAYTFGIDPDAFVGYYEIREQYDANGNGSYSNAEVKAAIDSMTKYHLTMEEKAALWQLMTGNKSAKNNPYSTTEGQRVIDYLQAD